MQQVIDFCTVTQGFKGFDELVKNKLKDGWVLYGNTTSVWADASGIVLTQAFVKYYQGNHEVAN